MDYAQEGVGGLPRDFRDICYVLFGHIMTKIPLWDWDDFMPFYPLDSLYTQLSNISYCTWLNLINGESGTDAFVRTLYLIFGQQFHHRFVLHVQEDVQR